MNQRRSRLTTTRLAALATTTAVCAGLALPAATAASTTTTAPALAAARGERSSDAPTVVSVSPRESADDSGVRLRLAYTGATDLQPTGTYLEPGEQVTINVKAHLKGDDGLPSVAIGVPEAQLDENGKRLKTRILALTPGKNTITDTYGGPVYLVWHGDNDSKSTAKVTIGKAAEQMATFTLGETTEREFQRELDQHTAPFVELVGDDSMMTFYRYQVLPFRDENHAKLMRTLDRIVRIEDKVAGYGSAGPESERPEGPHHLVGYPGNLPGAWAQAWLQFTTYSEGGLDAVLTVDGLRERGWGVAHELGHQHQNTSTTPARTVEVVANVFALAVQRRFTEDYGQQPRLRAITKDGTSRWDQAMAALDAGIDSYDDDVRGSDMIPFEQLRLAFGEDYITRWHTMVRQDPTTFQTLYSDDGHSPEADLQLWQNLVYATSLATHHDLADFWTTWGVTVTDETKNKIDHLPQPTVDPTTLRETNIDEPSIWGD
ncbi:MULTISPECIES: M60 family metallopeptidase [unclassified Isoptericola]|uniref:M60 family metallopeptidase n=1 Tax=unclassified Isoptericola TaxID=2623355 RepID=UPI00364BB068